MKKIVQMFRVLSIEEKKKELPSKKLRKRVGKRRWEGGGCYSLCREERK